MPATLVLPQYIGGWEAGILIVVIVQRQTDALEILPVE
jgi:hypothetical protein